MAKQIPQGERDLGRIVASVRQLVSEIEQPPADNSITNAMLADMAQATIKGRASGAGTGDPQDLTATQATAIINNVVGDSGSGGTKGLVPAPASGDAAAGKFLKADGTWSVPPSTIGTHSTWIPATRMVAHVTAGAVTGTVDSGSNDRTITVFDFADGASARYVFFHEVFPNRWDRGTVTVRFYWTSTATDTDGVAWTIDARASSDNGNLNVAPTGTVTVVDNAQSNSLRLYISSESAALTIDGNVQNGDLISFRVGRDPNHASDNHAEDARLIGVRIFWTSNAETDA